MEIALDPERFSRRVFWALVSIELLLVLLDATINWEHLVDVPTFRQLFNLGREDSLGNWYSSTQTFLVGMVLCLVALAVRVQQAPRSVRLGWMLIAGFFLYMGLDDGAAIHERVGTAVQELYGSSRIVRRYPSYTWQLAMGPFFGAMGLVMLVHGWRQIGRWKLRRLFLAGLGCYVLKVAIDFVEGIEGYEIVIARALGDLRYADAVAHFQRVIEEFIKMLGSSFFMYTFLAYLGDLTREIRVTFVPTRDREAMVPREEPTCDS